MYTCFILQNIFSHKKTAHSNDKLFLKFNRYCDSLLYIYISFLAVALIIRVKTTPRMIPAYATGFSVLATSPSAASTSITISSPASTFPDRISFAESVSTVF